VSGYIFLSSGSSFGHGPTLGSLWTYIHFRVHRARDQGGGGHRYDHGGGSVVSDMDENITNGNDAKILFYLQKDR